MMLGNLKPTKSNALLNKDTKVCAMVFGPMGVGKSTMASTLNELTMAVDGRPTAIIAMEASDGGGAMSLRHLDIDIYTPKNLDELSRLLKDAIADTMYGGIVFDSATEYTDAYLKPYAMKFPSKEGGPLRAAAAVPDRSDYHTMGCRMREDLRPLINMTTSPDLKRRKHLVVTALEKEKLSKDGREVVAVIPDLPGAMATAATAMFQQVGKLMIKNEAVLNEQGKAIGRQVVRVWRTTGDGILQVKDRLQVLPGDAPANFYQLYKEFWLPAITGATTEVIKE